jgi:hypothetical protein
MADIYEKFGSYAIRGVEEGDRPRLTEWIANDPAHVGILKPDFFLGLKRSNSGELEPDPRPTCMAMEDSSGLLFFIRISRAARVYIQFPPESVPSARRRIALGLLKGMAYLECGLARAGVEQWVFDTRSPRLKHVAGLRLGFVASPDEMVREIVEREA